MIEKASEFELDDAVQWGELKRTILMGLVYKLSQQSRPRAGAPQSSSANPDFHATQN
jgi:hypothetical protein